MDSITVMFRVRAFFPGPLLGSHTRNSIDIRNSGKANIRILPHILQQHVVVCCEDGQIGFRRVVKFGKSYVKVSDCEKRFRQVPISSF